VVKGQDSQLSGCWFKSWPAITLEKEIKVAKWGTPKKYFKKIQKLLPIEKISKQFVGKPIIIWTLIKKHDVTLRRFSF
jgi:hypothetical protein